MFHLRGDVECALRSGYFCLSSRPASATQGVGMNLSLSFKTANMAISTMTARGSFEPRFIWAEDFWRGLGTVYVCGRYASIDPSGSLFPLWVAVAGHLEPKKKGERFGFVDASGQFKIAPTLDEALPFSEGFAAVRGGDKWGFVNTSGHVVVQPQFKSAYYFREGVAAAGLDSSDVLIDTSGKVLAQGFQVRELVADGRVPASRSEKSGHLDLAGKVDIPFVYDGVAAFSGGLAAVRKSGDT